tara:strand:- start:120 stop:506 length:387 start_codon:yes stop_codon:yes gene_type:complete
MPRKRVRDQKKSNSITRLDALEERIKSLSDPEDIMIEIIDVFNTTDVVPEVGNYYTFIYNAKTPNITYDQHPLVAVTSIFRWGFQGINFHWNEVKRYTWQEVAGYLHVVEDDEIMSMRNINYSKFKRS